MDADGSTDGETDGTVPGSVVGASVGASVGTSVGAFVGASVGTSVGAFVGAFVTLPDASPEAGEESTSSEETSVSFSSKGSLSCAPSTLSCAGALFAPFSLTGVVSLFAGVCPPSGVEFCEDSSSTRLSVAGVDALPPAGSFSGGSSSAGVCFGAVAVGAEVETAVASGVSSA